MKEEITIHSMGHPIPGACTKINELPTTVCSCNACGRADPHLLALLDCICFQAKVIQRPALHRHFNVVRNYHPKYMPLSRLLILLELIELTSCGFDLVDLEYDPETFDKVAQQILKNPEVFQMDDFTRHNKFLNGIPIKLKETDGHSTEQLLRIVEDSLGLDSKIVSSLRLQLERTKLQDFFRSGDTILFTVDGMLDASWRFLYSNDDLRMDSSWFMFHGNSLLFTKDINKHWKKVAVK